LISQLLDDNPQLVSLVHQDLAKMISQSKRVRKSEYASEQILQSLLVMFIEQDSYRHVVIRIENGETATSWDNNRGKSSSSQFFGLQSS
jgi:hypothetical protein